MRESDLSFNSIPVANLWTFPHILTMSNFNINVIVWLSFLWQFFVILYRIPAFKNKSNFHTLDFHWDCSIIYFSYELSNEFVLLVFFQSMRNDTYHYLDVRYFILSAHHSKFQNMLQISVFCQLYKDYCHDVGTYRFS